MGGLFPGVVRLDAEEGLVSGGTMTRLSTRPEFIFCSLSRSLSSTTISIAGESPFRLISCLDLALLELRCDISALSILQP